jgi:hypothetical protein
MTERAGQDPVSTPAILRQFASGYLAGADPKTSLASPLFASLAGLPPLLVQAGTADLLLSDSERLATAAAEAGVDTDIVCRAEQGVNAVRTPVCELLGIAQPIILAPMVAVPRLAAAVSNAGALGMLTLTWAEDVGAVVRDTAALTARPFCGNLVLTEDRHRRLDQALDAGLRIVSFFLGDPSGYVQGVHDAGGIVMHTVGTAEEARRAVGSGVDVVVAQGWEAGGHVWGTVATLPLVPAVVDAVAPVPVIAAGGIGDARGVAAVLALGAQAAWLGTRFLLAELTSRL